jgi:hypothetical protein
LDGQDYAGAIVENGTLAETEQLRDRLVLIDATDTVVNKDVIKAYKNIAQRATNSISKIAVIGTTGIQEMFVTTISNQFALDIRGFDSKEDAIDWLTS